VAREGGWQFLNSGVAYPLRFASGKGWVTPRCLSPGAAQPVLRVPGAVSLVVFKGAGLDSLLAQWSTSRVPHVSLSYVGILTFPWEPGTDVTFFYCIVPALYRGMIFSESGNVPVPIPTATYLRHRALFAPWNPLFFPTASPASAAVSLPHLPPS